MFPPGLSNDILFAFIQATVSFLLLKPRGKPRPSQIVLILSQKSYSSFLSLFKVKND